MATSLLLVCSELQGHERECGVIVKSGVCPFELSGDLVDVCHLDSVFEFDSGDHLRQEIECIFRSADLLQFHAVDSIISCFQINHRHRHRWLAFC
jgi:hypothetical protein